MDREDRVTCPSTPAASVASRSGFPTLSAYIAALRQATVDLVDRAQSWSRDLVDSLIGLYAEFARRIAGRLADWVQQSTVARRLAILVDLGIAMARGMIADDVVSRGFDSLDDETFRDWLRRHGAHDLTIDSALIRGLHDFVFAHPQKPGGQSDLAAGVALRLCLKTSFGYRGAIMYRMTAGMGDVVFAPLYQLLVERGVTFRFFHRTDTLQLDASGNSIARINIERQAEVVAPPYRPLVNYHGLPCWPNQPRYEQLRLAGGRTPDDGDAIGQFESNRRPAVEGSIICLEHGRDFDSVLLGIPIGALRTICRDLIARRPAWRAMVDHIPTVPTVAAQLWLDKSLPQLGWCHDAPVLTGHRSPFETWADMTETLSAEAWGEDGPRAIAYFCGAYPLDTTNQTPPPDVKTLFTTWFERHGPAIWPASSQPVTTQANDQAPFDPTLLWSDHACDDKWGAQFFRLNDEPAEQYTRSVAGSTKHRLDPCGSGIGNLWLAGDWTRTELNVGCVEAAVLSGLAAARGLRANKTQEHRIGE